MEYQFILLLAVIGSIAAQDCVWDKDLDFPVSYPPLLVDKASWLSLKPVLENGKRIVREAEGASIVVACSGTRITTLGVEVAEGICSNGNILIGTTSYTVLQLACTANIRNSAQDGLGACGNNDIGTITKLGFTIPGYPFYPVVQVCFESTKQITLFSQNFIFGKSVTAMDGNPDKPAFKDDDILYPTIDPNNCYLTANQDAYATEVTGNPDAIDLNAQIYFSRGHLAPNADFILEIEADASYWYCNAVPQWQKYNAGNWEYLEENSRTLATAHQVDLVITSGPWDVFSFIDINSLQQEAYICDSQNQHIIPVPASLWKVIYDPVLDQGLAVITSNVPYQTVAPELICPDLDCTTIPWLLVKAAFEPNNLAKGFTYCCTVQDLHAANPHSPDYPTAGILMN